MNNNLRQDGIVVGDLAMWWDKERWVYCLVAEGNLNAAEGTRVRPCTDAELKVLGLSRIPNTQMSTAEEALILFAAEPIHDSVTYEKYLNLYQPHASIIREAMVAVILESSVGAIPPIGGCHIAIDGVAFEDAWERKHKLLTGDTSSKVDVAVKSEYEDFPE